MPECDNPAFSQAAVDLSRVTLDDPATRPMHHWRDTTSLDAREDRHRAYGEES